MSNDSEIFAIAVSISCILFIFSIFMLSLSSETRQKELYMLCLKKNITLEECLIPSTKR